MPETILIIGGTSGLGRGLAERYYAQGSRVAIAGRRKALLDEIAHSTSIQTFQLDISSADCTEQINSLIEQAGGVDKIIITASIVAFNPLLSFAVEEETIKVNVVGYTAVLNAAYHYFIKKGHGHIIGVTSIAAARGNKTAPAYNAGKAFQSSYLEGLRLKLLQENKNIYVTEIIPGYVATQMAKGDRLFWVAPLNKAVTQIQKAIEQKKQRAFVTKRWRLIYMLYKYLPSFVYTRLINSKIKRKQKS